ncbi:hypothetical protein V5799_019576 [Amblyomma americanum]|uniref:Uncharacterized protein n=1 Tax=Amblyomma americanum TaxID=6943 RepID=A0AAQ4EX92_AMBAM
MTGNYSFEGLRRKRPMAGGRARATSEAERTSRDKLAPPSPPTEMAKAAPEAIIGRRSAKNTRGGTEESHVRKRGRIAAHNVAVDFTWGTTCSTC